MRITTLAGAVVAAIAATVVGGCRPAARSIGSGASPLAVSVPVTDADFVLISPGTFEMGDSSILANERVHAVTLTHGFWIQRTPVTQAQWQAVTGADLNHPIGCTTCPADTVKYNDVQTFIIELNRRTGRHYRLPTDAEWEYAVRAGGPVGHTAPSSMPFRPFHPADDSPPNSWGLYGTDNGVWEWVSDLYGPYLPDAVIDPVGPLSGNGHILRSGRWYERSDSLSYFTFGLRNYTLRRGGFRLVRSDACCEFGARKQR